MAMGLVGVTGYASIVGARRRLKMVGLTSMRTVTDYTFGVIPMFMLMGAIVAQSGMSQELFRAANAMIGHWRGGLGLATIAACAGFAAISGSSVATAATFATVAYPEMRRHDYPQELLHRRHRGGRHAGRDLSALDRARGLWAHHPAGHRQAVRRRHPARRAGGGDVYGHHRHHRRACGRVSCRSASAPRGASGSPRCRRSGRRCCCSCSSSAASMAACSRRRRRAASAPAGRSSSASLRRKLSLRGLLEALLRATRTASAVFTVLIGALLFGYFLTVTGVAAEGDRLPHRPRPAAARRAAAHHADVSGARLPDGRDGDDHPHRAHRLSRRSPRSATIPSGSASSSS